MSINKVPCPACGAPLKSADGFGVGERVTCPKCETAFAVPEPQKAKQATDGADAPRAYKDSPLRYAVLGVLVLVMVALGVMLYLKHSDNGAFPNAANGNDETELPKEIVPLPGSPGGPPLPSLGGAGGGTPKGGNPKGRNPKGGTPKGGGLLGNIDPLAPVLGGAPSAAQAKEVVAKYGAALVGTWVREADGATDEVTYKADGTFAAARTGPGAAQSSGKYAVVGPAGSTGLKLKLEPAAGAPARTVAVSFDGDALEHPTLEKGVTATFQRK